MNLLKNISSIYEIKAFVNLRLVRFVIIHFLIMPFNKQKLQKLTEEFVHYILDDVAPDKMCFTVCYPLSLHLASNGYENFMKAGCYNSIPHYIVVLKNKGETIIDPTIRQFDIIKPQVLITNLSKEEQYKGFNQIVFEDVYREWLYPLFNKGLKRQLPREILSNLAPHLKKEYLKPIDIIPILKISARAAEILQKCTDQNAGIQKYLETVKVICNENHV